MNWAREDVTLGPCPGAPTRAQLYQPHAGRAAGAIGVRREASRPAPYTGGPMAMGRYECWAYSGGHLEAAMMENFSLSGGGRYADAGGHAGTYSVNSGLLMFHGGGLNGVQAKYIPGVPGSANPPHMQFIGSRGSGDECDGKG
jgi:hypothetical protein